MSTARLRTIAGLAAAIVPCAILVHLVAEALSIGGESLGWAFLVRHVYLGVIFFATATWFGRTVGVGCRAAERRRRCALIAAQLRGRAAETSVATLAVAHISFFGLSQLIEGVPIASGGWCFALLAAILGSVFSALLVYFCGRSVMIAALAAIGVLLRDEPTMPHRVGHARATAPRRAAVTFSLFAPNRPPPTPLLV